MGVEMRKLFFVWHSEAQFAMHEAFWCLFHLDGLGVMREWSFTKCSNTSIMLLVLVARCSFFVTCELNVHSGSLKSRLHILLLVVVQQRVRSTRSLASRLLFCQVDAIVRSSITKSSSIILCVPRYPACILLNCVLL